MSIKAYIKDQGFSLMLFSFMCILIYVIMTFWHISQAFIIFILGIILTFSFFIFFMTFIEEKSFTHNSILYWMN